MRTEEPCLHGPVGGLDEDDRWTCGDCQGCRTLPLPQTPTPTRDHGDAPRAPRAETQEDGA